MKLDVFAFQQSGEATIEFLKEKRANTFDFFYLIESIYIDFNSQLDAEIPIDNISYDAIYLHKLCKSGETDSTKARQFLARHLKKLASFMEENIDEYAEFIKDKKAKAWLSFISDESSGKNRNEYFPQLITIERASPQNNNISHNIAYRVSQLRDTPKLVKRFANFKFDGKNRWLIPSLIAMTYIAFLVLLFSSTGIFPKSWLSASIIIFAGFIFVIYFFYPYFKILDRSIVQAPQWLIRWNTFSAQIELISTGEKRNDGSIFVKLERLFMKAFALFVRERLILFKVARNFIKG
ncbi:MAG: hypothetical protein OCD00_15380 [Colwellia sp.]